MTGQLGVRIREARRQHRVSLRELSARTGLSISYLSEIERGHSSPTVPAVLRVAAALDLPCIELVRGVPTADDHAVRADSAPVCAEEEGAYRVRSLSCPGGSGLLEALRIEVYPGGEHRIPLPAAGVVACFYIQRGAVRMAVRRKWAVLAGGSSLQTILDEPSITVQAQAEPALLLLFLCRAAPEPLRGAGSGT
ncbi:MAG: helix-turn-helix domain-containing protein [Candidatus Eisenbacteria bacterium]|nr:helix-turn-helix domain-containing protein [Candidatus Eisenbacteria bacterium]